MPLATLMHKGVIKDKAINTLIQETDVQKYEEEYAKFKLPEHWSWIDLEARNAFHKGVGAGTLKCVTGYNHCGCRNNIINEGLADHFTQAKPDSDSESKINTLPGFTSAELLEIYDTNLNVDLFVNNKPIDQYEI